MSTMSPSETGERQRLIVGLGNPGARYGSTRHNLGFRVISRLAHRCAARPARLECNALVAECAGLILAMPQTFMNRSGYAVRCLLERRALAAGDLLVVYDDVALELGRVRLRARGGPGGHRGMESVMRSLATEEVARLRLGILSDAGSETIEDLVEFVLQPFAAEEETRVAELVERAADACESWLQNGIEATMNRFNC